MNIVRFLSKTTMAASIICAALAFSTSCSDDKDDNGGGSTGKWCVMYDGTHCAEIGKNYTNNKGEKMTEDVCNNMNDIIAPGVASIKDEKPDDCEVMTD